MDDMLTNRVSSVVRMDGDGDVRSAVMPLTTQSIGPHIAPAIEFMDRLKENRIGIPAINQGVDPEALHETATGVNLVLGRAQKRLLFIARTFAETGFKEAFRKLHALLIENAEQAYTMRLRGEWVNIDPRPWNSKMDVTVVVGLGYGTKETQVGLMEALLQKQMTVAQMQQGVEGPFLNKGDIFNALSSWTKLALGEKDDERYWTDPESQESIQRQQMQQQEPPAPDPIMVEAQLRNQEMQLRAREMQMKDERERMEILLKHKREIQAMDIEISVEQANMDIRQASEEAKNQTMRDVAAVNATVKEESSLNNLQTEQNRNQTNRDVAAVNATIKEEAALGGLAPRGNGIQPNVGEI